MPPSIDLTTTYLGIPLRNPIVASACPATGDLDVLKRLENAGVAAATLPSLFEEQIEFEEWQYGGLGDFEANSFAEAGCYFPELENYNAGPDQYLRNLEAAREALSIPLFGSLNGVTRGGWTRYAKSMESAGASAVELNMYYLPSDPLVTAAEVEQNYLDLVAEVKANLSIPLAVKIGPFFSSIPNIALRLTEAGADGLILFNRFVQPDLDLGRMELDSQLALSDARELRLPLRWIAILFGRIRCSLAATSGIGRGEDVLKMLLVGADAALVTSVLMKRGWEFTTAMLEQMTHWMREHGYRSVSQLKGSMSHKHAPNPAVLERSNYMKSLTSFQTPTF